MHRTAYYFSEPAMLWIGTLQAFSERFDHRSRGCETTPLYIWEHYDPSERMRGYIRLKIEIAKQITLGTVTSVKAIRDRLQTNLFNK
jgi:hypothetical protein